MGARQTKVVGQTGNGDGGTLDSEGRLHVTTDPSVKVFAPDGNHLGLVSTPRGLISAVFSGREKKTFYAIARDVVQNKDWILSIQMIATGPKDRGK